jgi:hypothetical protein
VANDSEKQIAANLLKQQGAVGFGLFLLEKL